MKKKLLSTLLTLAMLLSIFAISAPTSSAGKPYRCGDVDGNDAITIGDALEILKSLAKMSSVIDGNPKALKSATFFSKGSKPAVSDALEILKTLAKMTSYFSSANCYCSWCQGNAATTTTTAVATTTTSPTLPPVTTTFKDLTAQQMVASMRAGWNLGNTFDAHSGYSNYSMGIPTLETMWNGGVANVTTKSLIQAVKKQGSDTIRIPVTWYKVADKDNNWTIRQDWINRIKEVVNWVMDEKDMYVIINIHHEELHPTNTSRGGFSLFDKDMNASKAFVERMWEQIAPAFNSYDHRLIFEVLNEPRGIGSAQEWSGGTQEERLNLNVLSQIAVDTIRKTGGNNLYRILMVPTYAASSNSNAFYDFKIPDDPLSGTANKIALSVHAYIPRDLCETGPVTTLTEVGRALIPSTMDRVANQGVKLGVPVIMGEFGAVNKNNVPARAEFAELYVRTCREKGIVPIWWDNGSAALGTSVGSSQGFGLIQRPSPHNAFPVTGTSFQPIIDAIFRGAGSKPAPLVVNPS